MTTESASLASGLRPFTRGRLGWSLQLALPRREFFVFRMRLRLATVHARASRLVACSLPVMDRQDKSITIETNNSGAA